MLKVIFAKAMYLCLVYYTTFLSSEKGKAMRAKGLLVFVLTAMLVLVGGTVWSKGFNVTVTDQTPTAPLANPIPNSYQSRYISGLGIDNTFKVFFEDRDAAHQISYNSTTIGPNGFAVANTDTNISDTHFLIKNWPITIGKTEYAYRAWASVANNMHHHFYVSNDLINWILVSTFTIPNADDFTDAHGIVYYGFHDVILLNGTYYAFAESNQSQTMIVRSSKGDDRWEAFASVGGRPTWGPLELPSGVNSGWTVSGNFVDLGYDHGYGKIYCDPRDNNFYLAINLAAKPSLAPADLEAAFINPANWTWHDGTTGPAANAILSDTSEHDLRECWMVPKSDPNMAWTIIYTADFGAEDDGKAVGYATMTPPHPTEKWVDQAGRDSNDGNTEATAYATLQMAIDNSNSGTAETRSIIHVKDGNYGTIGKSNQDNYRTAIRIQDLDYLTIQAVADHNPKIQPSTEVEAKIVSISIENCDHLIIDNIDSDQTIAQFDNWHVWDSDDLTVRNSTFEGGEDGIDFNTDMTTALIENNTFKHITSGSGNEVLDFTSGASIGVTIQDNSFIDNYRHITLGGGDDTNFIIRRNVMDGTNSQEAIHLIGASDVVVENNVVMNSTQQGIYIDTGCSSITIRHNSFFNNGYEELRTKVNSADIDIKNNIFYANGTYAALAAASSPLPGEDYNLIYNL